MTKDATNEDNQVTASKNVSLVSMNIIFNKSGTDKFVLNVEMYKPIPMIIKLKILIRVKKPSHSCFPSKHCYMPALRNEQSSMIPEMFLFIAN